MLRKGLVILGTVFLGLASGVLIPETSVIEVNAETQELIEQELMETEQVTFLTTEDIWKDAYSALMYESELSGQTIAALAMAEVKSRDLELMSSSTDHIVNYHGKRYAITDDEYQLLLRLVEAEAGGEDIKGRMLVANVVLNRVEAKGKTVTEVIFQKKQFSPVSSGKIFRVKVSEKTIEAVERVLAGEDESQGALYFMARKYANKKSAKWFDSDLKFLFKHGVHEFFTKK